MFEKWNIPDNLCDNYPIGSRTLELFVGHKNQTGFLADLLSNKSIIVLEGEVGVGKTSLGNFIRFSKKDYFTPLMEIPCKHHWNNDIFMGIILAAIVKEILRDGSPHHKLKKNKLIRKINEIFEDVKLANLGISGAGFGVQRGESMTRRSMINQTILVDYLSKIGNLLADAYAKDSPVIIQVNNLDMDFGFGEGELSRFFDDIRDTLQLPFISWIICGSTNLGNFLKNNVPRVGQILNHDAVVSPLTLDEIMEAFNLRIKRAKMTGKLPIEKELLEVIYDLSGGSFRDILNIIYQLLVKYYNEPLVKTITKDQAQFFFYELGKPKIDELAKSKPQYRVFGEILKSPGINQKDLVNKTKIQQSNLSKITKDLESLGLISIKKISRNNYYTTEIKLYLGYKNRLPPF